MNSTITYSRAGDYLLPNLTLNDPPRELAEPLGRYGKMRKAFLKEHRTARYNTMLLGETLYPHLREIDQSANSRMEILMPALVEKADLPDKTTDPLGWAAAMNGLRAQAEELILSELIYS
jgi:hypothetical protein